MKNPIIQLTGTPPRLIPTLLKGFNTIANNVYLILFPVVMDLFLWLGPKLRLKNLLLPSFIKVSNEMMQISPSELTETVKTAQTIWEQTLDQFNLLTLLRTFPVGIPSIMARESPINSPLGSSLIYEVPSSTLAFGILLVCVLIGFLLGSLYFYFINRVTASEKEPVSGKQIINSYVQSMLMFCLILLVAILILAPLSMILSVLSLLNSGIGQFFLMVAMFALVWMVMPLIFSPHGVFVGKIKAIPSMLTSIRLVRSFLPGTGLFVMTCVLINEGLNMLWIVPAANSWLTLLSIFGHSFIVTGLLAASFIYYRDGLKWMQDNLHRIAAAAQPKPENGGTTLEQ